MERCPNCRARWDGAAQCRRCGMELSLLVAAEQAARRLVDEAVARLVAGEREAAAAALLRARALRREPFIDLLLGFVRSPAGGQEGASGGPPASSGKRLSSPAEIDPA